ncbi:TolC family protein [Pedobacter cryotolerans]|uniref:TolC family protein n=1 Tax=Pedobacter cryotolerans TaxID=2571270 RepID=A0A4U1C203_9SPHI|nr:TolC family protein [Pedobacter cryotolerans]TKB99666.1 TolC family protein [Pedobacter cryotolerans]
MKTKFKITLLLLVFCSVASFAQETIIPDVNAAELDKYIQMAKEFMPKRKIQAAKTESVKTAVGSSQVSYLDLFSANYFYRPSDRVALNPLNPFVVNGMQYGISLNLGTFLQKPFAVKKAKADYKVAQLEQQDFDIQLANEVRRRYYDYVQSLAALKINTLSAQDSKGVAESMRYKFEKGEVSLDAYNQSRLISVGATTAKIQSEVSYLKAKDLLEEMIGQKIATVK